MRDFLLDYPKIDKPVLIIGKGPTYSRLSEVNLSDYFVVGINDVCKDTPVDIAFFIDTDAYERCLPLEKAKAIVRPYYPHVDFKPTDQMVKDEDKLYCFNLCTAKKVGDSQSIKARYYTSEAVVNLLAYHGVKTFRTVGIDGGMNKADPFKDTPTCESTLKTGYTKQFIGIQEAIEKFGLDFKPLFKQGLKICLTTPFIGRAAIFDKYADSAEAIIKEIQRLGHSPFMVIYDNSNSSFSQTLKDWAKTLLIPYTYHADKVQGLKMKSTIDYLEGNKRVAEIYSILFGTLVPKDTDFVINLEDDVETDASFLGRWIEYFSRQRDLVSIAGNVYDRYLEDKQSNLPMVCKFKISDVYPRSSMDDVRVEQQRMIPSDYGFKQVGSTAVALWMTKFSVLSQIGWDKSYANCKTGDMSWGLRLKEYGLGKIFVDDSVQPKHWNEDGTYNDHERAKNSFPKETVAFSEVIKTGSPRFINGRQVTK